MAGLLDRLFGPRTTDVKAVVGTGAYWMEHGVPLRSISRDPTRLLAEAQRVYHTNEWVHAAESLIDGKFATVPWHLERDGETVEDGVSPQLTELLRNPSTSMTRTHLWRITCRHLGLTGNAFWYLDQQDQLGVPTEILYLNPARMTPAVSPRGQLKGWIVDADRPNGVEPVPLNLEELIHFVLDPPDFGHYGIGKVEAAWRKIGLSNAAGSFAEGTLLSGGRKAHMIWPDGVTVEGEQWDNWVNGLRNAQEDGSFTRRLTANRFPIGNFETGQTMEQLRLPDLAQMGRDDIMGLWGVPLSQIGIMQSSGLNSGEHVKYEEAALWQGAIETRLVTFLELVQARLVDPFGLSLILETPEFDDSLPLYDIASKAITVPHKADELRALVGLDPLDEAIYGKLGLTLLLGNNIVEFKEPEPTPPALLPFTGGSPPPSGDDDDAEMPAPGEVTTKARLNLESIRRGVEKQYPSRLQGRLQTALSEQREAIANAVVAKHAHIAGKLNDTDAWWNEDREHQRLAGAVDPIILSLLREVSSKTSAAFFTAAKADLVDRVAQYVNARVGDRIRGINKTTRDAIRVLVGDGISNGLSPAQLGVSIREATQFNEERAELIARTETMLAYNDSALGTYRAFDVEQVQAIDGDTDEECAARNGNVYSLSEASGISDHPNGTLDWVPIVKAIVLPDPMMVMAESVKAVLERPLPIPVVNVAPAKASDVHVHTPAVSVQPPDVRVDSPVTVNVPEQAAPVVNVAAAEVNVAAAEVNVPAPVVNVKADLPASVKVTSMPDRSHKVVRDAGGTVVGSVETD